MIFHCLIFLNGTVNCELELELIWWNWNWNGTGGRDWNWNCERNGKNCGTAHALVSTSTYMHIMCVYSSLLYVSFIPFLPTCIPALAC